MGISTFFDIRGLLHMNDLFSVLKKNNYFVTFFFLAVCTLVAFLFAHVIPGNSPNIALVYILWADPDRKAHRWLPIWYFCRTLLCHQHQLFFYLSLF